MMIKKVHQALPRKKVPRSRRGFLMSPGAASGGAHGGQNELATKLGTTSKRVRSILRSQFPRDTKNKNWEISLDVAKKVEKHYKERLKAKEQKKLENNKEKHQGNRSS